MSASRPQREPGPAQPGLHRQTSQGSISGELHDLLLALTITAFESHVSWAGQGAGVVVVVVVVVVVEVVVDVVVVVVVVHVNIAGQVSCSG